jgi:IcmF-related N-terminal domain
LSHRAQMSAFTNMSPIIKKPLELLESLFVLVFPMFDTRKATRLGDPASRWLGRIALVGIVLGVLAVINQSALFGLSNLIHASAPWVGRVWLPLVALCLYVMLWLGWWLYGLLNLDIEPIGSDYPEIDRAWDKVLEALAKCDIALDNSPLFLILGWPSDTNTDLFRAAGIKGLVREVPEESDAPLHVTANRDGIWLTCPGVSLLGQYRTGKPVGSSGLEEAISTMSDEAADPFKTMGVSAGAAATLRVEDFRPMLEEVQERARTARSKRPEDADAQLARLRHLCRLINRDRQGFCPINGVLITLPMSVEARSDLGDLADACRKDLSTAFEVFRMRCPVLALVNGLEQVAGFSELIKRLPPEHVKKRMGQRFPLLPHLDADELPNKINEAIEVVSATLFPSMIHSMFQIESQGLEDVEEVLHSNIELFRFQNDVIERGEKMARLIKDCIPVLRSEPLMFGGCYFAGTGHDPATQHAFASGVFMRMIKEDQDSVTWIGQALDQDANATWLASRIKLAFLAIITLGVLAAGGLVARRFLAEPANSDSVVSPKSSRL